MDICNFEEKYREQLRQIYLESRRRHFTWLDQSRFSDQDFDSDTESERIWVIGGMLLQHCMERVKKPLRLKCMKQNLGAMAFYKNKGWAIESDGHNEQTDYYLMRWGNASKLP